MKKILFFLSIGYAFCSEGEYTLTTYPYWPKGEALQNKNPQQKFIAHINHLIEKICDDSVNEDETKKLVHFVARLLKAEDCEKGTGRTSESKELEDILYRHFLAYGKDYEGLFNKDSADAHEKAIEDIRQRALAHNKPIKPTFPRL
jgi:hypothetical protein